MQPALAWLGILLAAPCVQATGVSPTNKVVQLIGDLTARVMSEGEASTKIYAEFAEWCEDRSFDLQNEIKTGNGAIEELKATISGKTEQSEAIQGQIEEFANSITESETNLKGAKEVRARGAADFVAAEKDLVETVDVLHRAITVLEKKTALVQVQSATNIVDALKVMVQAASFSSADSARLAALVQSSSGSGEADGNEGTSENQSNDDIINTMESLLDTAEAQLEGIRSKEANEVGAFAVMALTLHDQIKGDTKELAEAKKDSASAVEAAAVAEGELKETSSSVKAMQDDLADLHQSCMERATDYEDEMKSRGDQLTALTSAKKLIAEATSEPSLVKDGDEAVDAQESTDEVSLLQVASATGVSPAYQLVHYVRGLAKKQRSPALAQLAIHLTSEVMHHGASVSEGDIFAKVKGLIRDMIQKLEKEAAKEADHKAFCDQEMSETETKKEDKGDEIEKLRVSVDKMSTRSVHLRKEISGLDAAISKLVSSMEYAEKIRQEEHAHFVAANAVKKQSLTGIKMALKVLKDYYAKDEDAEEENKGGGSAGIIALLETCESDFVKSLEVLNASEEDAQTAYEKLLNENEILKATLEQDIKYKTKEVTALDLAVAQGRSDQDSEQAQLDAVLEYYAKIREACVAKASPYAERARRREKEIEGLEGAEGEVSGDASLLQQGSSRQLRGPNAV